jgi:hypothetical protein
MSRSPRCQRTTGRRPGRAHVCRAGSCAMVLLDSTAFSAGIHRSRACSHDTKASCPRARCRSFLAAFRPGSGRRRWSDHIESRCARRCRHLASTCRTRGSLWLKGRSAPPFARSWSSPRRPRPGEWRGMPRLRIGRRDELRDNVTGGAPRLVVEGCQILLHRAA